MAQLAAQKLSLDGLNPSYAAAAGGGDTFPRLAGDAILHVKNGSASSVDVTLNSQATVGPGEAQADKVVSVPASEERLIADIPEAFENDEGNVEIAYSAATTVTVAVFDAP